MLILGIDTATGSVAWLSRGITCWGAYGKYQKDPFRATDAPGWPAPGALSVEREELEDRGGRRPRFIAGSGSGEHRPGPGPGAGYPGGGLDPEGAGRAVAGVGLLICLLDARREVYAALYRRRRSPLPVGRTGIPGAMELGELLSGPPVTGSRSPS